MADIPTSDVAAIAASVRAEVARRRVRQAEIAGHLDLDQRAVSRRLLGQTPFKAHELQSLAALIGVDVAVFYAAPTEVPA